MSEGYVFECGACGKMFGVFPGAGVSFPTVYEKLISDIKAGVYGSEWQRIPESEPFTAVDAETYLFKCASCGHWEAGPGLSLYAPNNLKTFIQNRYGQKTVQDMRSVTAVRTKELQSNFHVIKRALHPCPVCGKRMRKAEKREEFLVLPCPKCASPCTASVVEVTDNPTRKEWKGTEVT